MIGFIAFMGSLLWILYILIDRATYFSFISSRRKCQCVNFYNWLNDYMTLIITINLTLAIIWIFNLLSVVQFPATSWHTSWHTEILSFP